MRQKRKIVLVVIAVMMVLTLSACGGKGDVKTFVKKMQKVENLDYEIHTYRRYVASQGSDRLFRGESQVRQGKMQLDPQVFSEYYSEGSSNVQEPEDVDEHLIKFGSSDFIFKSDKIYSPKPKKVYIGSSSVTNNYEWVWKEAKDINPPEIGNSKTFLDIYEKYADKFKLTEDENHYYLDYKGDVSKNLDQMAKLQVAIIPKSKMLKKGKKDVKSCKIEIHLVMKKGKGGPTPYQTRIKLITKMDVPAFGGAIDNEDYYQAYYRDINDVKEIKKPYGFDASKVKKSQF